MMAPHGVHTGCGAQVQTEVVRLKEKLTAARQECVREADARVRTTVAFR